MTRLRALGALLLIGIGCLLELAGLWPEPRTNVRSFTPKTKLKAQAREADTVPAPGFETTAPPS